MSKQSKALTSASQENAHKLDNFFEGESQLDLLRFITCGSVDDGKSTLIGRLLYESQMIFDDQMASLEKESKKQGTQGDQIDFALLVDGLAAEREQGITIDVAYRFFATKKRKFIVADTPGHEQYTRNMVTGASTADVALLLVDARVGLMPQTKRHAYLASLMGIKHVLLVVNKMDLVDHKEEAFRRIEEDFMALSKEMNFESPLAMPLSALKGENIMKRSPYLGWYKGPTLMGYLETVPVQDTLTDKDEAIFPVQWVSRPSETFRGYAGTLAQGRLKVGDEIRATTSGQTACIESLVTMDGLLEEVSSRQAVTITLDREIEAARGEVFTLAKAPLSTTDQFEATLVWMIEPTGLVGRSYDLKLATQTVPASLTSIKHLIDIQTFQKKPCKGLHLNDIAVCVIATQRPIVYTPFEASKTLGGFILIDRMTHATVAAGVIRHTMRRAQNVHTQPLTITKTEREKLNAHKGRVIWFTGLSGSGKSTYANALEIALHSDGYRTYLLDGDNVRHGLSKDLGFTEEDRVENIRRVAEVAKLMLDAGLVVIASFISPFARDRQMVRELVGEDHFVEVYVATPLEVCETRDPKGLYGQARKGLIPNFSGINSPYEAPEAPDVLLQHPMSIEEGVICVQAKLKDLRSI